MSEDKFKVDIRPDVAALRIFRSMSFTPWYALGEFVDNSITSAIKNLSSLKKLNGSDYELQISIDFDKDNDTLLVTDNAAGISRSEIERALKTGIPPADTTIGLSKHGVGMKAAALWWGRTLTVETYPIDEPNGWRAIIDVSDTGDLESYIEVTSIPSRGFPGTRIFVQHLWRKAPQAKTVTAIRAYLPSIYRSYLNPELNENGFGCTINYEGKELSFKAPELLTAPYWPTDQGPEDNTKNLKWELKNIDIELSSGTHVKGWIGILETMRRDYSGFFLHYRGKGISGVVPITEANGDDLEEAKDAISRAAYKPRKIFGQQGHYKDQSFVGEFDITDFGKTITTDAALWSPQEENEFVDKLFEIMSDPKFNFIKMAENYRRNKKDRFDRADDEKSDVKEAKIFREAFDNRLSHTDPTSAKDEPLSAELLSIGDDESQVDFDFNDQDGHHHKFTVKLVKDRSRDFLTLSEDKESRVHHVYINQFHSCLTGIMINTEVRRTLQRIGAGLAISEVLLTDTRKKQLRTKMNETLRNLQNSSNVE
jgi:hypothetical protein